MSLFVRFNPAEGVQLKVEPAVALAINVSAMPGQTVAVPCVTFTTGGAVTVTVTVFEFAVELETQFALDVSTTETNSPPAMLFRVNVEVLPITTAPLIVH